VGRLIVALITIAMAAAAQTSTSWRSASTLELVLPSSTDCWEPALAVGPREQVYIVADHGYPLVAAREKGRVCVVWVDDRRGALDTFARCSTDSAKTWGADILLSNRIDGAAYKSPQGFTSIYGHYGGAAISSSGRLFAVWAEGEREYRTGNVWFNSVRLTTN
jgi:hypothetical protein